MAGSTSRTHPFCGGVPTDIRMTTRYTEAEFLSRSMGIMHETGHGALRAEPAAGVDALAGRPGLAAWPCTRSQSLFVEKEIARSPEFWQWAMPHVARKARRGRRLPAGTLEDVLAHVHFIKRGLIRVDADEATYPLHVILRFELEQGLIDGSLAPRDLPEAWDAKMREYLGLSTIDNMKDGPMQDVHWPSGAIGYFPSYTLGAHASRRSCGRPSSATCPNAREDMRNGRFVAINDWRRDKIWSQASKSSTPEMHPARHRRELSSARHFQEHLTRAATSR